MNWEVMREAVDRAIVSLAVFVGVVVLGVTAAVVASTVLGWFWT